MTSSPSTKNTSPGPGDRWRGSVRSYHLLFGSLTALGIGFGSGALPAEAPSEYLVIVGLLIGGLIGGAAGGRITMRQHNVALEVFASVAGAIVVGIVGLVITVIIHNLAFGPFSFNW